MPIRPEMKALYPADWRAIANGVKDARADEDGVWRCEGSPAYPDCRARHGEPHPVTGSTVIITVAHLNHDPADCRPEVLRSWCQRCHNTYDAPMRAAGRKARAAGRGV